MSSTRTYIILRDLWKNELRITKKSNGACVTLPIQGGARGLFNVPSGKYTIVNHGIELQVNLTDNDPVQVWQLDSSAGTWKETKREDDDFGYHDLAQSGAMDRKLINLKEAASALFHDASG